MGRRALCLHQGMQTSILILRTADGASAIFHPPACPAHPDVSCQRGETQTFHDNTVFKMGDVTDINVHAVHSPSGSLG